MKYSSTHTAYFNEGKIEVPSVTTVLKILNKPALVKWANFLGFKRQNVEDVLNQSAIIGTQVHQLIYAYFMDRDIIWIETEECSASRIIVYLDNFFNWKKRHEIKPIFMEKQFSSKKFGGTLDFYGEVDGKKTILDFKTSKSKYSSMFLQLGAYCLMLEEQGYEVDQVAIININDKKYIETFMTRKQIQKYMDVFLLLVELFHNWYELNLEDGWGDVLGK